MKTYCNLHAHSTGSLLDGMSKFDEYANRAKKLGQPAITFTDHGNLHGLLNGYDAAQAAGIKYMPGIELYQARKTRFDVDDEERASSAGNEWGQKGPYHLGVIAYNNTGYQNLLKLSSRSFLEGYYVKPRADHELLADHSDGLVVLSGCLSGEIQQALLRGNFEFALQTAATMQEIVGRENYFIEVQNHFIEEELQNHEQLLQIAKIIGAPVVATCDSHYTHKEDCTAHDLLLCTNTKSRVNTPNRFKFSGDHFYLKSFDEMAELFPEEFLLNTLLVAEKCEVKLSFDEFHIPNFPVGPGETQESYFVKEVVDGATEKFGDWRANTVVAERIEHEMEVIKEMGFPNYFLIVADLVNWANNNGIMTGAGRGSAAGSIVSYCLGITQVNPLLYGLPFERFLVRGRKNLPDIDLDFDDRYRERVIEYARSKYGYDHTASIGTISEIGAKSAIKDVARSMDYPFDVGTKINNAMPPATFGVTKNLTECLLTSEFSDLYHSDETSRLVIDAALKMEGLWRHTGVHAAGLVICDKPVQEYVPVMQKGKMAPIVTQWDMDKIDRCGLLKVDFLGLRNISIVDMTVKLVEERHGIKIDKPYDLVNNQDPRVYEALSRGENIGVFQMESQGLRQLMIDLKPSELNDITALLALYRPGPMGSNVHNEYVERKHGRKPITYVHAKLKPILVDTYGLLLYQEQILRIAREVAGFTVPEADDLRKIVGKKIIEKMPKMRKSFVEGCINHSGLSEEVANRIFSDIEHHASYSFSSCHATAYAYLTYVTSYLRTHYPIEFMTAALSSVSGNEDRLRLYLNECKRMGFTVIPPSINTSGVDFKIKDDNTIIFGFNAVKGVGEVLSSLLGAANGKKVYRSVHQFLRESDENLLDRGIIQHFIKSGCFDDLLSDMEIDQGDLIRDERISILYDELSELGVFLTDHPMNDVYDLIAGKITHSIKQLSTAEDKEKVKIAGVVIDVVKKMTKTGKKMFHLLIDDLEASVGVSIMPKRADELPDPPFEKGDIIIITGKVDRSSYDENAATTIIFWEAEKIEDRHLVGGKPILLKMEHQPSFEQLNRINDIIESVQGNSPVLLSFKDGNKEIQIKFNQLTSKSVEDTLLTLVEVQQ